MRKILLFIITILIFIPTFVFAEDNSVVIESITMIDKSPTASELSPAKADGTSIDLDISFAKVNDYIKYKLVVKNNTDDDYVLDESMFIKKYTNVSYTFETDNKTVKSNSTREVTLNVKYEVAKDYGVYNETNTFDLGLTGGPLENPSTGVRSLLFIIPIALILGFIIVKNINNRKVFKAMIIIVGVLSIPTIAYALNKCIIKINSKITIENCRFKLVTDRGTFEEGKEVRELCLIDEAFNDYDFEYYRTGTVCDQYYSPQHPHLYVSFDTYGGVSYIRDIMNDSSYINFYSDAGKTNLIRTVTKKDFPDKDFYSISNMSSSKSVYIPLDGYTEVYYDSSSDLQYKFSVRKTFFEKMEKWNYKYDVLTTSKELGDKIDTLYFSDKLSILEFSNCNDGRCEGNVYHAVWGVIYK